MWNLASNSLLIFEEKKCENLELSDLGQMSMNYLDLGLS